jgi:hypothetical protein
MIPKIEIYIMGILIRTHASALAVCGARRTACTGAACTGGADSNGRHASTCLSVHPSGLRGAYGPMPSLRISASISGGICWQVFAFRTCSHRLCFKLLPGGRRGARMSLQHAHGDKVVWVANGEACDLPRLLLLLCSPLRPEPPSAAPQLRRTGLFRLGQRNPCLPDAFRQLSQLANVLLGQVEVCGVAVLDRGAEPGGLTPGNCA